jgi:hypothetical protein
MRNRGTNPNPPICRSKNVTVCQISFTDCETGQTIGNIYENELTLEECQEHKTDFDPAAGVMYFSDPAQGLEVTETFSTCAAPWWCCTPPPAADAPPPPIAGTAGADPALQEAPRGQTTAFESDTSIGENYSTWLILAGRDGESGEVADNTNPQGWNLSGHGPYLLTVPQSAPLADYQFHYTDDEAHPFLWVIFPGFAPIPLPALSGASFSVIEAPPPPPDKVCAQGTRKGLEGAGYAILSGPYDSQEDCEANCGA